MLTTKKCKKCKKDVNINLFQDKIKNKEYVSCLNCRQQSRLWRQRNKERVAKYNNYVNTKNKIGKKVKTVYGRKVNSNNWIKFNSQTEAAEKLNLKKPNVNKVIKGSLKTTGGYEFKVELEDNNVVLEKNWKMIKEENNYSNDKKKSPNRIEHIEINGTIGKTCCTCREWRELTKFNKSKSHWDKLRNDCKECIKKYRKKNREKINKFMLKYEKHRKKTDPNFKLMKTLRSRLGNALTRVKANKSYGTIELTGCTVNELKKHIEKQFTDDMTWQNHGSYWHLDHIIPCSAFNLENSIDQLICFNYINLQPLKCKDNLCKGNKYTLEDKKELYKKVMKIDI